MIKRKKTWSFPKDIAFEMTHIYSKKFEEMPFNQKISFDLSRTKNIHSSFIGFLIDAKQKIEKKGGSLELNISPELEKIFINKELNTFLIYNRIVKTA